MTLPYQVKVAAAAARQLRRLPVRVAPALVEFVTSVLPMNPARLSKPLGGSLEGLRTARRGDYRVLLWIDDEQETVVVVRVAHRANVYRSRPP